MILTCSACQSQYVLPDGAITTKARRVKCASCGYSWLQQPITVTEIDLGGASFDTLASHLQETAASDDAEQDPDAAYMARRLKWRQAIQADITPHIDNPAGRFASVTLMWFGLFSLITAIVLG